MDTKQIAARQQLEAIMQSSGIASKYLDLLARALLIAVDDEASFITTDAPTRQMLIEALGKTEGEIDEANQ